MLAEEIQVAIRNPLSQSIYAPPSGYCALIRVQRSEPSGWALQESCPTLNVNVVEIPPSSQLIQALGTTSSQPPGSGMLVLGPFYPLKTTQDLRGIPTVTPWQPGDPTHEIPEGAIAPFFSALETDLVPGIYRLEFRYILERYTDVVQTVYSQPFKVISAEPASGP